MNWLGLILAQVLVTVSGSVVTANGPAFKPSDVGRSLKLVYDQPHNRYWMYWVACDPHEVYLREGICWDGFEMSQYRDVWPLTAGHCKVTFMTSPDGIWAMWGPCLPVPKGLSGR